jgi:hypothetical protein
VVRVTVVVLVCSLLWIGLQVALHHGQPIGALYPGELSTAAPLVEEHYGAEVLIEESTGYDGTAFWAVAMGFPDLDEAEPYVAEPRYRFQRILTPAVASVGGHPDAVAVILLILGALGAAAGAGALSSIGVRHGRPAWIGYLFFFPLVFAVGWGTAEPVAFGLAMLGVALADRSRLGWAALAFTAGALAREPVALMAVASGAGMVFAGRIRLRAAWPLAVPGLAVVAWMLYLAGQYPAAPNPDRLDPLGLFSAGPTGILLGLLAVAAAAATIWGWRDVPAVWPLGVLFVLLTLAYGDAIFRFQVVYRSSAPVLALGLAAVLVRLQPPAGGRQHDRQTEPQSST